MNAPVASRLLARREGVPPQAAALPPAPPPAQRMVWNSPFGPIVIEVVGDEVFVNGDKVQPVGGR